MAKKSITDNYFAIGTDRITEQHEQSRVSLNVEL